MSSQLDLLTSVQRKPRVLVFDLETIRSAGEVGGWENIKQMGMACGVVYDSQDEKFHTYFEKDAAALVDHLFLADLVVGFNQIRFDYAVLTAYTARSFTSLPSFDILLDVDRRLGHRLKLNSLATATLKEAKSADGMQSLIWVKEGKLNLVADYCRKDVEVTKRLFDYGVKEGRVYYYDRSGEPIELKVDWDIATLVDAARKSRDRASRGEKTATGS